MKYINYVLFSFLLILMSCNKEESFSSKKNSKSNTIVRVAKMVSEYNDINVNTKSLDIQPIREKVIASSTTALDNDIVLVAELVQLGKVEDEITKVEYNTEPSDIKTARIVTFYDSSSLPNADKLITESERKFGVSNDCKSTLYFLADSDNKFTQTLTYSDVSKSFEFTPTPESRKNLFVAKKEFTDYQNIPKTVDLVFNPLFSKITTVNVSPNTTIQWPIASVGNIKITKGAQNQYGKISVKNTGVTYVKNAKSDVQVVHAGKIEEKNKDVNLGDGDKGYYFIPSSEPLALSADVVLEGKETKTINLNLNKPVESGYRFKLMVTVRQSKIKVHYVVNPNQNGDIKNLFKGLDVEVDYGAELQAPTNVPTPVKAISDYVKLTRWSKVGYPCQLTEQIHFKGGKYIDPTTGVEKDVTNPTKVDCATFPSLKTSNDIYIYAFWEPTLYRWDAAADVTKTEQSEPSNAVGEFTLAKTKIFEKLPSKEEYRKYLNAEIFYDSGYTDLKFPGVWLKKWNTGKNAGSGKGAMHYEPLAGNSKVFNNNNFVSEGVLPPDYDINDFFFIPFVGSYLPENIGNYTYLKPKDSNYQSAPKNIKETIFFTRYASVSDVNPDKLYTAGLSFSSTEAAIRDKNDRNFDKSIGACALWNDPTFSVEPVSTQTLKFEMWDVYLMNKRLVYTSLSESRSINGYNIQYFSPMSDDLYKGTAPYIMDKSNIVEKNGSKYYKLIYDFEKFYNGAWLYFKYHNRTNIQKFITSDNAHENLIVLIDNIVFAEKADTKFNIYILADETTNGKTVSFFFDTQDMIRDLSNYPLGERIK